MGRPKGSKNKVKKVFFVDDVEKVLEEKNTLRESLVKEISDLSNQIATLRAERRTHKVSLKSLEKEITKIAAYKAAEEVSDSQKNPASILDEV
ncbi:MAG: hypothetical protein MSS69_02070 [Spirochaetales bacterium]|nr:hypothetical protein [Spirochaetales bacterium]